MSVIRCTLISCDGCGETFPSDAVPEGNTAADIRSELRLDDWRCALRGGEDYCPDCWDRRGGSL